MQLLFAHGASGRSQQHTQRSSFALRQCQHLPMQEHRACIGLHLQRPPTQRSGFGPAMAAQQDLQAGFEFTQIKGLWQIVIGPHVQAQHPVRHAGTGRQNDHRYRITARTQSLQHTQAVLPRQLQVKQDRIKGVTGLQTALGLVAVGGKFNPHAALAQGGAQPQGDVRRVFHQQNARH
jgi:hypothetical protein